MVAGSAAGLMSGVLRPENVGERPQCPLTKKVKFKAMSVCVITDIPSIGWPTLFDINFYGNLLWMLYYIVYGDGHKKDKYTS